MINKIVIISLLAFFSIFKISAQDQFIVNSPDGKIQVNLSLDKGVPLYLVKYEDSIVIRASKVGVIRTDADLSKDLRVSRISGVEAVSDIYRVFSEKRQYCKYNANKRSLVLTNSRGDELTVIFQVSNNGVAFRYYFRDQSNDMKKIMKETTAFHFPVTAKAWLHPHTDAQTGWEKDQPSYEEHYKQEINVGEDAPYKAGWSFPALFKSAGCWVLVTEADVDRNYCGSRLSQKSPDGEYTLTFPQPLETVDSVAPVYPESELPWFSPWRVIMIGQTLAPIVESTLVTDLSAPSRLSDTSYIKPGKASWSWVLYKDDSTIYSTQKRFIDYAAKMNWQYCLIDALWDKKIGYEKIQELVDYAKTKNVGIILWYNSAGSWNTTPLTPRNLMINPDKRREEFEKISKMGVKGVKVDFFGGDGQSMIAYYHDLFEDAAKYKLLINCHGATVPRGWTRTYPNLVSMEAVEGFEFITFDQVNADLEANHCSMLPFVRNVVGPMDFTPVCFSEIPHIKRKTTNGFELALSVIFQSGIQHYAEVPEGMFKQPDYVIDFMKKIPSRWDDIKLLDGYPGKYVVLARKANNKWYIGAINGQDQPLELNLDLSILGKLKGIVIKDGNTDRSFAKEDFNSSHKLKMTLKPQGGFVVLAE